ncbi:MAG: DMT family transporter [Sphingomonas sp.]
MTTQAQLGFVPLATMMFVAGLGIPIFAAFNSALGQQLHSPVAASTVTFVIGLVLSLVLLAIVGFPPREAFVFDRPYIWLGAIFMIFYATTIAFAAPRIGVGNAVFFVLLGQLVAAAAIDHFGLWGAMVTSFTARRALGIAVMALGVYLARKPV